MRSSPESSAAYDNPRVGRLRFDVAITWLEPDPGLRLLVHLPADAETEERLRLLEAGGGRSVPEDDRGDLWSE
ncbi:MAG: hypothetical protein AAGC90_13935 [Curtobacterium sp.]|jgi:hypothetical protein